MWNPAFQSGRNIKMAEDWENKCWVQYVGGGGGARGGAVGCGTSVQAGRSRVRFPMVSVEFLFDIILPVPGIDSASNRNEYQEYFVGGKGGRCVGLTTLPLSCADCLEIWESQPPGTLRACPGLWWDCFTFTVCGPKRYWAILKWIWLHKRALLTSKPSISLVDVKHYEFLYINGRKERRHFRESCRYTINIEM
jgi:hypothetical protein